MQYEFRENLLSEVRDYASNTPAIPEGAADCSLGVNPYGFAPEVERALKDYDYRRIMKYPHSDTLHHAIADYWSDCAALKKENIALCNGSFLGLYTLNQLFAGTKRNKVISFVPAFTDMLTSAAFCGMEIVTVPADAREALRFPVEKLIDAIDADTALVYLDRPNNPTGSTMPLGEVREVLQAARAAGCFVLADEAYADFIPKSESAIGLFDAFDNLIVTRTFSKGMGLADLRAGYILAPELVVALLNKTLNPYILSESVRLACERALAHPEHPVAHADDFAAAKRALRVLTGDALAMMQTDDRVPILTLHCRGGGNLQRAFLAQGVLTVSGAEFESLDESFVRISIPAGRDLETLLAAVKTLNAETY